MLRIQSFSKTYAGGKKAVDDLTLTVQPGEIVGFIGHNGAGKSTTLRACAGVLDFTEGTIAIDGHDVRREPGGRQARDGVSAGQPRPVRVHDRRRLSELRRRPVRHSREGAHRRIANADAFELTGDLGSAIGSYSHGMRQKLALISAFMRQPKLMILDEPMVGLDPSAAHLMKEFLAELCARGSSVFFSTHVLEVAEKLCNRIAIIKQGRLIRYDRTENVVGDSSLESVFLELEAEKQ